MDSMAKLQDQKNLKKSKKTPVSRSRLRFRLLVTVIVLLVMFTSFVGVTFAWYVYQTGARTSDIRMAVGTGSTLQISNQYDGSYGNSTVMDVFKGALVPVSTDCIQNGFQKVTDFTDATTIDQKKAYLFGAVETTASAVRSRRSIFPTSDLRTMTLPTPSRLRSALGLWFTRQV